MTPSADARPPAPRRWWRLVPIVVLALGLAAFFTLGLGRYLSLEALSHHHAALESFVAAHPISAPLVFMTAYALAVAFSLPVGALATILGGLLFGAGLGTLWVVIGASTGATLLFLAARTALGDALRRRAGGTLQRMEAGFRENAFSYLLALRLVPFFPFFLVNIAPAFLGVPLGTYVLATLIGIVPGSFVYASIGQGAGAVIAQGEALNLGIIFTPAVLVPIIGLALLALLPVAVKRWRGRASRERP